MNTETRFVFKEDDADAKSLAIKLSKSLPGELIPLTEQEMKCLLEPERFNWIDIHVNYSNKFGS